VSDRSLTQPRSRESHHPLRYTLRPDQADVAQLVEQLTRNEQVSGSSPLVGSYKIPAKLRKKKSPGAKPGLFFVGQYTSGTPTYGAALGGFSLLIGRVVAVFESVVHRARGVLSRRRHPVRVAVEGKLYRAVAEKLLDVLRVRAAREQEGGACEPEIVPAYIGQSHAF
jgi:hypothetical protein